MVGYKIEPPDPWLLFWNVLYDVVNVTAASLGRDEVDVYGALKDHTGSGFVVFQVTEVGKPRRRLKQFIVRKFRMAKTEEVSDDPS